MPVENIQVEADGSLLLDAKIADDPWIKGYLLSYGRHFEVLEPESWRQEVHSQAESMCKKHKS
jgi:predicted DNA-binding transcriptional regulator YafY